MVSIKEKKWLYVERERASEYFHSVRVFFFFCFCFLPDVLSRSSEMEKAAVEEEMGGWGSRQAERRSHVHHHLFVYIETTDHLETDSVFPLKVRLRNLERFPEQKINIGSLRLGTFRVATRVETGFVQEIT